MGWAMRTDQDLQRYHKSVASPKAALTEARGDIDCAALRDPRSVEAVIAGDGAPKESLDIIIFQELMGKILSLCTS